MISNQILQNTIDGLKGISGVDFIVLDNSVSKSIKTMTTQYYDKIYNNDTFSVYELKKRR